MSSNVKTVFLVRKKRKGVGKGVESFVDIFFYSVFEISKLFLRYYYAHWFFSSYDSRTYL